MDWALGEKGCDIVQRAGPKERSGGWVVGGPVRKMCEAGGGLWLGKWQDRNEESWGRKMYAKAGGCFLEAFGLCLEGIDCPHPWPGSADALAYMLPLPRTRNVSHATAQAAPVSRLQDRRGPAS